LTLFILHLVGSYYLALLSNL